MLFDLPVFHSSRSKKMDFEESSACVRDEDGGGEKALRMEMDTGVLIGDYQI